MANEVTTGAVEPRKQSDCLYGEWRQPINRWADLNDSIHNDQTARKIGMRGGTIPGTVHLGHFRPLIEQLWGDAWYRTGSVSMYYTYATQHLEDVRAVIRMPERRGADEQVECWVELRDGTVAAKGTLAVGRPEAPTYVQALSITNADPSETRILAGLRPGLELAPIENVEIAASTADDGVISNPMAFYSVLVMPFPRGTFERRAVGFFGATEVVVHAGPIRVDGRYRKTGQIAAVSVTPKTEVAWVHSQLWDETGTKVAEMRHMTRWMKASSALWNPG